jgi:hypothetical protein
MTIYTVTMVNLYDPTDCHYGSPVQPYILSLQYVCKLPLLYIPIKRSQEIRDVSEVLATTTVFWDVTTCTQVHRTNMSKEPSTLKRAECSRSTTLDDITLQKAVIPRDFHTLWDRLYVTYFI